MNFLLRQATEADVEALGIVHVQAWREAYVGLVPDDVLRTLDPRERAEMWRNALVRDSLVQLAIQDDAIVGFGSSGAQRDASLPYAGEIRAIYVLERAQRQGIGRTLMAAMACDLLAQGYGSALLWVIEGNTRARRFYEALGGRQVTQKQQERGGFGSIGVAYGWEDLNTLSRSSPLWLLERFPR